MSKRKIKAKTVPPRLVGEWVSAREACQYMDVCFNTLRIYIDKGRLTASQIVPGGKIRVSTDSIKSLMNQAITPGGAQ